MNYTKEIASLVPYLEPTDTKFHLKLSMIEHEGSVYKGSHFPFVIVSDADPVALILEAALLSDAGSKIKSVFLLIQKDDYQLTNDALWPINNRDVDRAWQNLFSFLTAQDQNDNVLILKDQVDNNGQLLPWAPLFYCQHRQLFFQPPCPNCGFPLKICYDDNLLVRFGLQPYIDSLKRYLFCPNCIDTLSKSDFYVHSLEVSDPAILSDKRDLIRGFGQMVRDGNRDVNIPCLDCVSVQECYETGLLCDSRIVAISFYPFFMVALEAPSIHIFDFLSLIAGADINDLANRLQAEGQLGRLKHLKDLNLPNSQKSLLFFDKDEKYFLEVLYLKLSIFGELAQIVFDGQGTFKDSDLALSLDQFWVHLPELSGKLPVLWNFKLNLIGFGGDFTQPSFLRNPPPSYALYFLGSSWFFVLLVNSRQDFSIIYPEIEKVIDHLSSQDDLDPGYASQIHHAANFSLENIFWNPEQKTIDASWQAFWAKSLDLGLILLKSSMSETSQSSQIEFWQDYEQLRADIKNALFMPEIMGESTSGTDDNKAIHEILVRLVKKWRDNTNAISSGQEKATADMMMESPEIDWADAQVPEDILIKETVILSADDFREKPNSHGVEDDHVPKTVVVRPEPAEPLETQVPAREPTEDLPKTVILGRDISRTETPSTAESQENNIPETVTISPQKLSASPMHSRQKQEAETDNSGLTEQTISDTSKTLPIKEVPTNLTEKDDDIPKTLILDPNKTRDVQSDHD